MYRVIWLMKRRRDLTHEAFREHFERSHAPLALKHVGHLFADYRRMYPDEARFGGDPRREGSGFGPGEWQWDLISEWTMPDEAAFDEIMRIMAEPAIMREFEEDEDRFIDREATVMIRCTAFDSGRPLPST